MLAGLRPPSRPSLPCYLRLMKAALTEQPIPARAEMGEYQAQQTAVPTTS